MTEATCLTEHEDGILWIRINRPHVLNALDPETHRAIADAFDAFEADDALRVAIITGKGDRAFCVGSDLKKRAERNADDHPPTGFAGLTHRFGMTKPVIAAVNGLAIGGGVEIVTASDIAIAAEHAEFSLPEPRVGLAAWGGGGLQRLARQLPLKFAMELALTGRRMSAGEARQVGLINEVVPGGGLEDAARAKAEQIIAGAPLAIAASKQIMLQSLDIADLETALRQRYEAGERMLASEDAIEGQAAFVEKRQPKWQGR